MEIFWSSESFSSFKTFESEEIGNEFDGSEGTTVGVEVEQVEGRGAEGVTRVEGEGESSSEVSRAPRSPAKF